MYSAIRIAAPCLFLYTLLPSSMASAEDWPTFRGPDRTGVSSESGLLDSWPEDGPELVYTAAGAGKGYASPAIADGRIYTLGDSPSTADDNEYLTCFDETDGKIIWRLMVGPVWQEHKQASWNGARGTPTVDGQLVYVITPHGKLVCATTATGESLWEKDLKADFGGKKKDPWGYSESPLVDGEHVLCTPGGEEATVIALNKATGALVWKCQRPGDVGAGHSSIVVSQVGGKKVYVQNTGGGPLGVDAETGAMLWDYDIEPPTAFIPTPIVKDDLVFTAAGYGTGGALLRQVAVDGNVTVEEVYGVKTKLMNKHGGVVCIGDHLYFGRDGSNIIVCADLLSGDVVWEKRGAGKNSTSVSAADGKLFVRFQNGPVSLVAADPAEFKLLGTFSTPGSGDGEKPSWAHPVISGGKLYLREDDAILCYDISK